MKNKKLLIFFWRYLLLISLLIQFQYSYSQVSYLQGISHLTEINDLGETGNIKNCFSFEDVLRFRFQFSIKYHSYTSPISSEQANGQVSFLLNETQKKPHYLAASFYDEQTGEYLLLGISEQIKSFEELKEGFHYSTIIELDIDINTFYQQHGELVTSWCFRSEDPFISVPVVVDLVTTSPFNELISLGGFSFEGGYHSLQKEINICCIEEEWSLGCEEDLYEYNDVWLSAADILHQNVDHFGTICPENDIDWFSFYGNNFTVILNGNILKSGLFDKNVSRIGSPINSSKSSLHFIRISGDLIEGSSYSLRIQGDQERNFNIHSEDNQRNFVDSKYERTKKSNSSGNGIVYPNPVKAGNPISFDLPEKVISICIIDLTGEVILTNDFLEFRNNFHLSLDDSGLYYVKIFSNDGVTVLPLLVY